MSKRVYCKDCKWYLGGIVCKIDKHVYMSCMINKNNDCKDYKRVW